MKLLLATAADAPAIARVHVDSWNVAYCGIISESFLKARTYERCEARWRERLATSTAETYLVQYRKQTVGILTLGAARDADLGTTRTGEIAAIYLSPGHWRKGIGRQVMAAAERMLISRGYEAAIVWVLEANERARRFYEAMGFALDGASHDIDLGEPIKAVRYRKGL